jgi:hypothetical protein
MDTNYNVDQLKKVIESLEKAIKVNQLTQDDPDKGYPYAAGYSCSAMKTAVSDLSMIVEDLSNA